MRRILLLLLLLLPLAALPAAAQDIDLRATLVASGVGSVTDIVNAGDGSNRLFFVRKGGDVLVFQNGLVRPERFIDISNRVNSVADERGLLSATFAPNVAQSRRLYLYYTRFDGDVVLSRFTVSADLQRADPASEEVLLVVDHPLDNHNGGKVLFGPDGYLYLSIGDGGGAGDPPNNAQNRDVLLGKVLRLDVSIPSGYAIPPSNPYTASPFRQEIWSYGLRNPWRMSFDPATGELYIGDVGQNRVEEIDLEPPLAGGRNYGWRITEGDECFNATTCDTTGLTPPIAVYTHDGGRCSVTGGYVYRGARYPDMVGVYFFADYCSGTIFGLRRLGPDPFDSAELRGTAFQIQTFGVDELGDLYIADAAGSGAVYVLSDGPRITAVPITAAFTGTWYDPAQNGHGLFVEVLPNGQMVAAWFTFGPNGGQAWLFGQGPIQNDRAVLTTYIPQGGRFIPNFNPNDVTLTPWGTLTFTFETCNRGRVDFASTAGFGSGSMQLTRLTQPAGLNCGSQ